MLFALLFPWLWWCSWSPSSSFTLELMLMVGVLGVRPLGSSLIIVHSLHPAAWTRFRGAKQNHYNYSEDRQEVVLVDVNSITFMWYKPEVYYTPPPQSKRVLIEILESKIRRHLISILTPMSSFFRYFLMATKIMTVTAAMMRIRTTMATINCHRGSGRSSLLSAGCSSVSAASSRLVRAFLLLTVRSLRGELCGGATWGCRF